MIRHDESRAAVVVDLAPHDAQAVVRLEEPLGGGSAEADDEFRLDTARALHRNLVKIPKSEFAAFRTEEATSRYVKGEQAVALVQPDGSVDIAGLKDDRSLHWHIDRGLEIRRGTGGNDEHEPSD